MRFRYELKVGMRLLLKNEEEKSKKENTLIRFNLKKDNLTISYKQDF